MSIEKKSGVYKITNIVNGHLYVGSAVLFKKRWTLHKSKLRTNSHHSPKLQNAWNKHGECAFTFSVIEECEPIKEVLLGREQYWIDKLQACGPNGYNMARFAGNPMLGRKHSKEAIEKISIASKNMSQESREKMSESNKGKKRNAETRKKMSESQKGKKATPETRAKISAAVKNRPPASKETRKKISESGKGRKWSEESKKKMSEVSKNRSPEHLEKLAIAMKNRPPVSKETREKISEYRKGKVTSEETKAKLSASQAGRKKSPEAVEASAATRRIKRAFRLTLLPIVLAKILFLLYGMPVDNTPETC